MCRPLLAERQNDTLVTGPHVQPPPSLKPKSPSRDAIPPPSSHAALSSAARQVQKGAGLVSSWSLY